MIVKPELVKKIREYFGLNIYETKAWLALMSKGVANAREVAELSGVPRSRTYDVLEGLEKQGFAIAKIGKPVKFIAVKPTVVLERLKGNTVRDAEEKVKVLEKLKDTKEYSELEALHRIKIGEMKTEEISGELKGKNNIYSHAGDILKEANQEILVCVPVFELMERKRIFKNLVDNAKKKNLKIKMFVNGTEDEARKISVKYGTKVESTNVSSKFFIADRKSILFSVNNPQEGEEEIGIWLNSGFLAGALCGLFSSCDKN